MSEPTPTPPRVGDKVVYADLTTHLHEAWQKRTRSPSLVIDGPRVGDGYYHMYSPDGWGEEWFAPAGSLRVVERATYSPPGEPDASARLAAAHDALTRILDGDTEDFATLESTVEYVVKSYRLIAESEAQAADELFRVRRAVYPRATDSEGWPLWQHFCGDTQAFAPADVEPDSSCETPDCNYGTEQWWALYAQTPRRDA